MVQRISQSFPDGDTVLHLRPEELGFLILKFIAPRRENQINSNNFIMEVGNSEYYAGKTQEDILHAFAEAWDWLVHNGMLSHQLANAHGWAFVTREGRLLLEAGDVGAFLDASLIRREGLDPALEKHVLPLYLRSDFDTAIFRAFKEVEVRVRQVARLQNSDIGTDLARKAFHPTSPGPLTDTSQHPAERQATADLFAGALGLFKNPSSHREVVWNEARDAAEAISLANLLLRMVDRRRAALASQESPGGLEI